MTAYLIPRTVEDLLQPAGVDHIIESEDGTTWVSAPVPAPDLSLYMPKSGGTFTGPVTFDSAASSFVTFSALGAPKWVIGNEPAAGNAFRIGRYGVDYPISIDNTTGVTTLSGGLTTPSITLAGVQRTTWPVPGGSSGQLQINGGDGTFHAFGTTSGNDMVLPSTGKLIAPLGYQDIYFGLNSATGSGGAWGQYYGAGYWWGSVGPATPANEGWLVDNGSRYDWKPTYDTQGISWSDVWFGRTGTNTATVQQPGGGAANLAVTGDIHARGSYIFLGQDQQVNLYNGIWLDNNAAAPSLSNYALLGVGGGTILNSPTGTSLSLRIGNANKIVIDPGFVTITDALFVPSGGNFGGGTNATATLRLKAFAGNTRNLEIEGTGGVCVPLISMTMPGDDFSLTIGASSPISTAHKSLYLAGDGGGSNFIITPQYPVSLVQTHPSSAGTIVLQSHNGTAYVNSLSVANGGVTLAATTVSDTLSCASYIVVAGPIFAQSHIELYDKAGNNWLPFATRNTSGSEAVFDLSNIGTLTVTGTGTFGARLTARSDGADAIAFAVNSFSGSDGDLFRVSRFGDTATVGTVYAAGGSFSGALSAASLTASGTATANTVIVQSGQLSVTANNSFLAYLGDNYLGGITNFRSGAAGAVTANIDGTTGALSAASLKATGGDVIFGSATADPMLRIGTDLAGSPVINVLAADLSAWGFIGARGFYDAPSDLAWTGNGTTAFNCLNGAGTAFRATASSEHRFYNVTTLCGTLSGTSAGMVTLDSALSAASVNLAASANLTAQSATVSSVATFTPTATGTYLVGVTALITAISAGTLTLTCTYTDPNSNPQTVTFGAPTATGDSAFPIVPIRAKISTAITVVATFAGVSITYDVGATITKVQ